MAMRPSALGQRFLGGILRQAPPSRSIAQIPLLNLQDGFRQFDTRQPPIPPVEDHGHVQAAHVDRQLATSGYSIQKSPLARRRSKSFS